MPIDYDALAKQNGAVIDYDELAKKNGAVTSAPTGMFDHVLGAIKSFAAGGAEELNPITILQNTNALVNKAFYGTVDTANKALHGDFAGAGQNIADAANAITAPTGEAFARAQAAYKRGDYNSAAAHLINYAIPFGSAIEPATKEIEDGGDPFHAIGRATGTALTFAAPESPLVKGALSTVRDGAKVVGKLVNPNPAEAAAVRFGQANDIPVSAKVATGNSFVGGVQKAVDHSPIGSIVAQNAKKAEAEAFTRVGGELAEQASPGASVAPTQAGSDISSQIHSNIETHGDTADQAYSELRELESDPANLRNVQVGTKRVPALDAKGQTIPDKFVSEPVMKDVPLPVDLKSVKKQLRPIYKQLSRQLPITKQRMSTGYKALENILNGPDAAAASQVDRDLGAIKAAARGDDEVPEMKTLSQGLAAQAVKELHGAVSQAVSRAERTAADGGGAAAGEAGTISATDEYGDTVSQPAVGTTGQGSPEEPAGPDAREPAAAAATPSGPRETIITVPGESGNEYPARYEIVPHDLVDASHDGRTFNANPNYGMRNDRQYGNPVNQRKVVEWSTPEQFDPKYHVNTNPDATNGPPIAYKAADGRYKVLGGSGRNQIMDRVFAQDPEKGLGYTDLLANSAPQFGEDAAKVRTTAKPQLLRVIDESEIPTLQHKQDAITDFNKVGTAALTPAEQAIADARRVSPETISAISQRLEELGPDATMAQALEGRHGVDFMQQLIADKVISPQEGAKYLTEDALTLAGKQRVGQLMLGRFFRDAEQIDNLPAAIRGKLERIAGPLAKIEAHGEFSLTEHVREGIGLLEAARKSGLSLEEYLDQGGLLKKQQYSQEAQAVAHGLTHGNPLDVVRVVNDYAEHAKYARDYQGPGMFGDLPDPHTPRSAFNAAFGTDIREGRVPDQLAEPAPIPQKSADFDESFKPTEKPKKKTAPPVGTKVGDPAGDEALEMLERGRRATEAKYKSLGVLKKLPGKGVEGRQVFEQAIWSNDAGIEHLKKVAAEAPEQMPRLGRAYLEDVVGQATAAGGFDKAGSIWSKWRQLGPETKKLLYPNPMLRQDLDNFFLLAKKAGEVASPNDAKTVGAIVAGVGYVFTHPVTAVPMVIGAGALSKMMHSPAGIRALSNGLSVRLAGASAAEKLLAAQRILKAAGPDAERRSSNVLPFPADARSLSVSTGRDAAEAIR